MKFLNRLVLWLPILMLAVGISEAGGTVHVVMLAHRISNAGEVEAASVNLHCILPDSNKYHDLIDMKIDPEPSQLQIDGEGQKAIKVSYESIAPGQLRTVRVLLWVKLKTARVRVTAKPDDVEPLLQIQREGHLADGRWLQLDKVRPIAQKAAAGKTRDIDQARALYNYMAKYCRYNIDETTIAADAVLAGEPASCSELAITYMAMCRSLGIPARLVTAYVNRGGKSPSIDWQSHRWAEFFAEGIGWVPVDPTNRMNYPKKKFFAQQQDKYLTVVDDGVPLIVGPDPAWMIMGFTTETKDAKLEMGRSAVWQVSLRRQGEAEFFEEACGQLKHADAAVRLEAIEDWQRERRPLRLGFLLEALFDVDANVRKTAAGAIGEFKDVSVILPLLRFAEDEKDAGVKLAILNVVRQRFADEDAERRIEAIVEVAKSRTDEALDLLDDTWEDPELEVRKKVALVLYKFGDKDAVHKGYRRLVDDPDETVRVFAALRWARTGSKEALTEVVGCLQSPVRWDREKALAELVKHTRDDFGYNPRLTVNNPKNVEAVRKFDDWIEMKKDKK
ncbi:MAG: HEAT repeat domain-containing protein [Planctomycetota bacterium]|nr:MAG: HEAT repeat domain-containing protein [Planctomycetota bacterium]